MVLITTGSHVEGWEIANHIGVVSSHIVTGTNIFSDVAASFTDIFGGRSESYQKQLSSINREVLNSLKYKTERMGGNLIIGLHIDHDQISGGNKSMFMVTAYGTAVMANKIVTNGDASVLGNGNLDSEQFQDMITIQKIIKNHQNDILRLSPNERELLIRYRVEEIAPNIFNQKLTFDEYWEQKLMDFSLRYFSVINPDISKKYIYGGLRSSHINLKNFCLKLIEELKLLDFNYILTFIESDSFEENKLAISLLKHNKSFYSARDIHLLELIKKGIEYKFPLKAKIVENSRGFLSKNKEMWECECGKLNDLNTTHCTKCNRDKYGFTHSEGNPEQAIQIIDNNLDVLKGYFKN